MQAARESVATNLSNCKDEDWRDDQIVFPRPYFRPSSRISFSWGRESCVTKIIIFQGLTGPRLVVKYVARNS